MTGGGAREAEGTAEAEPSADPGAREDTGADEGSTPLVEAVERMAHQLKNPLQAVAVNLEVIRSRVRGEAPELWERLERFGRAVDDNVDVLDRRLGLLLALGRRGPEDELREADPATLAEDLATALRMDEEPPGVEVTREGVPGDGLAARLRPGHLLALLLDAWLAAARAGAERTPVTPRRASGSLGLSFPVPRPAAGRRDRWSEMARAAGGTLEVGEDDDGTIVRVTFPTV